MSETQSNQVSDNNGLITVDQRSLVSKAKDFSKDFVSDPALIFTTLSDPLIFMTPEYLNMPKMEEADVMFYTVLGQAFTALAARAKASYIHVFDPDNKNAQMWDQMPLRISGYTHLALGMFLAFNGQAREAGIAIPLGVGNLQMTGDVSKAKTLLERVDFNVGEINLTKANIKQIPKALKAFRQAWKSPNSSFATANVFILLPPMAALAKGVVGEGALNVEAVTQILPAIPLSAAIYFIGKNALNEIKDNSHYYNQGYPLMLIGGTAGVGGAAGFTGLTMQGKITSAFNDLGSACYNAADTAMTHVANAYVKIHNFISSNDIEVVDRVVGEASKQIQDPDNAYVAAVSLASAFIFAAYSGLERRYASFYKKGRPTKIPKNGPSPV